jgi:hypothetical protein
LERPGRWNPVESENSNGWKTKVCPLKYYNIRKYAKIVCSTLGCAFHLYRDFTWFHRNNGHILVTKIRGFLRGTSPETVICPLL